MENLPSTIRHGGLFKRLFNLFNSSTKVKKEQNKPEEIINKLGKHKEFDVDAMDLFKYHFYKDVYKTPEVSDKGYLFMGDFNNIYQANRHLGKSTVNNHMKSIIHDIKEKADSQGYKYRIGKLGDELYMHIKGINDGKEAREFRDFIQSIEYGPISISAGYTNIFNHRPEVAYRLAELGAEEQKEVRKKEIMDKATQGSLYQTIGYILAAYLDKLRIDISSVNARYREAIIIKYRDIIFNKQNYDIQDIIEKSAFPKKNSSKDVTKDSIYDRIEQLLQQAETIREQSAKDKYILSNLLMEDKSGYMTHEQFLGFGYENVYGYDNKSELSNMQMFTIELIGKKYINDTYGHEACDEKIKQYMQRVNEILVKHNINRSGIIKRGISTYYCLTNRVDKRSLDDIKSEIRTIQSEFGSVTAFTDILPKTGEKYGKVKARTKQISRKKGENKSDLKRDVFANLVYGALSVNEKSMKELEVWHKIHTPTMLETYIIETLREIINNPTVQKIMETDALFEKKIKKNIMDRLEDLGEGERVVYTGTEADTAIEDPTRDDLEGENKEAR